MKVKWACSKKYNNWKLKTSYRRRSSPLENRQVKLKKRLKQDSQSMMTISLFRGKNNLRIFFKRNPKYVLNAKPKKIFPYRMWIAWEGFCWLRQCQFKLWFEYFFMYAKSASFWAVIIGGHGWALLCHVGVLLNCWVTGHFHQPISHNLAIWKSGIIIFAFFWHIEVSVVNC